jgi:O-antigen/teichoic acid export membrane protein
MSFGLRVFGMVIGYLFTLYISNYYGASVLGLYSLSFVFLQIIATISRLGIDTATVKFIAEFNEKKEYSFIEKYFSMINKFIFPFSFIVSIVTWFSSPYIAIYLFEKEYLTEYFQLISLSIVPYTFIFIYSEGLRGLHKIKEFMFLQNISNTFIAIIILIFLTLFFVNESYNPILALVVSLYATFFLGFYLWKKELKLFSSKKLINKTSRKLTYQNILQISLPLTLTSYLALIMGSTDTIMIGMYLTEKEVGLYSVVLKLSTMSLIIFTAVNTVTVAKFSSLWAEQKMDDMRILARKSTNLILYISLPIFLTLWIFPNEILSIFGSEFREASFSLIVMIIGQFLFIVAGPVWQMMNMTDKQKVFFYFSSLSAIINVVLNYYLIPIYGIDGAAIATVTGGIVLNVLSIVYIKFKFNFLTVYLPVKNY